MTTIERLRKLDAEATGGPWKTAYWPLPVPHHWVGQRNPDPLSSKLGPAVTGPIAQEADADLISEARNALPDLLTAASVVDPWKLERIAKVLDFFDRVLEIADTVLPGEKEGYTAVDHTEMQDDLRKLAKALDPLYEGGEDG